MGVQFLLMVNKQGQTRLAKYFSETLATVDERRTLEGEVVRRCLSRTDKQVCVHVCVFVCVCVCLCVCACVCANGCC